MPRLAPDPSPHAQRHVRALLALTFIALLTGCATGTHWRMDEAQPHARPPSSFSLAGGPKQKHHIHPRYLGGPESGPTVDLDPAHHQLITNEFRRMIAYGSYGSEQASIELILRIMRIVYSKYPLPGVYF